MSTPKLQPWQRTIRTVFQALLGLVIMIPLLVSQTGLDGSQIPWLAGVLAVCAVITRIMATPAVETFLQKIAPWLSAGGSSGKGQGGYVQTSYLFTLICAAALGVLLGTVLYLLTS